MALLEQNWWSRSLLCCSAWFCSMLPLPGEFPCSSWFPLCIFWPFNALTIFFLRRCMGNNCIDVCRKKRLLSVEFFHCCDVLLWFKLLDRKIMSVWRRVLSLFHPMLLHRKCKLIWFPPTLHAQSLFTSGDFSMIQGMTLRAGTMPGSNHFEALTYLNPMLMFEHFIHFHNIVVQRCTSFPVGEFQEQPSIWYFHRSPCHLLWRHAACCLLPVPIGLGTMEP